MINMITWGTTLVCLFSMLICFTITPYGILKSLIILIPASASILFILSLYFNTYYLLNQDELYYRSGPFYGKISYSIIKEIQVDQTSYSGFKPALASKGIIVKYNSFDDIYISPNCNKTFVEALLERIPELKVSYHLNNTTIQ